LDSIISQYYFSTLLFKDDDQNEFWFVVALEMAFEVDFGET